MTDDAPHNPHVAHARILRGTFSDGSPSWTVGINLNCWSSLLFYTVSASHARALKRSLERCVGRQLMHQPLDHLPSEKETQQ